MKHWELRWHPQPEGSKLCGQCCVVMLTGVTEEEAIKRVGHARGTHFREVADAVVKARKGPYPYFVHDRLQRVTKNTRLPKYALLRIRWNNHRYRSHWVILKDGEVYCSIHGTALIGNYLLENNGRVSSYAEIVGLC